MVARDPAGCLTLSSPFFAVAPLNIRLLGAHQALSANRRYDLLCQSAGSRPPAVITWFRDGVRLDKTTETVSIPFLCRASSYTNEISFEPIIIEFTVFENGLSACDRLIRFWQM
jgi:CD80-like C2-set immunoglobulin domain